MPGLGTTIGIAGHRTTFGAWFRHIDSIRNGDWITLQMPYATSPLPGRDHQVVASNDWAIIKPHGYDERLILSLPATRSIGVTPLRSCSPGR